MPIVQTCLFCIYSTIKDICLCLDITALVIGKTDISTFISENVNLLERSLVI